ncbi:MAG: BspA family leucine-rich repeat surface protein [Ekhidna sp.]|nr:BspA family leucine-rich repeat surface protein [Ekhidna sp.]
MSGAFWSCYNFTIAEEAGIPNLSNVTDMFAMFFSSSINQDISNWDVSKVTNMTAIFQNSSFNQDIGEWNVSSVTSMRFMFYSSPFNQDISEWDISSVTDMTNMFGLNTSMSSENYDKLLIGWSTLDEAAGETKIPSGIPFTAPRHYTCKGEAARNKLIKDYSWSITDDSKLADAIDPTPDAMTLKALTACVQITENELNAAAPAATDNCPGATVMVSHDITSFPIISDATVTWTFTDEAGNTATQTQTVTIEGDTEAPEITGTLQEVTAQCPIGAENELTEPAAPADNCEGTVTVALKTGTPFPIQAGTTTITWIYTDESGNTFEQTQKVTIADTEAPRVTGSLSPVTAQCPIAAAIDLTKPAAPADNCGGTVTVALKTGTPFPIQAGTTTITWIYTDESGNTSEQTQEVIIDDTEVPTVTDLNAITAACSLEENDLTIPKANDVCDGEIMGAHNVTNFPITSNTSITWTFTDKAGNIATQTQEVTITDCPSAPEENEPLGIRDDVVEAVVFPNPSGRYVEVQSPVESTIRILSVGGELMLKSTTNVNIDADSLQSGLYMVQLPDGRLLKFVKR